MSNKKSVAGDPDLNKLCKKKRATQLSSSKDEK